MAPFRRRFIWSVVLLTFCLLAFCVILAISLFRQQKVFAETLRENVASRRAAVELEECLTDLVTLENASIEAVAPLHERVRTHLKTLNEVANEAEELRLYNNVRQAFEEYLKQWRSLPPASDTQHEILRREATERLERDVLKPCTEFRLYNGRRLEESTEHHERILRQFSWGIAGIGLLGCIAGLVLGFGVTRGLSRSINEMQVRIRNATDLLSPQKPEIVLTGLDGDSVLKSQFDKLTTRIEETVSRLQQREREVLRAEQLAATGQLAAGVGHEIRNPLTSIKMLVQSALEQNGSPLTPEDLRVIENEVRRMERSLQGFLAFARPPQAEKQPTDLIGVANSIRSLIRGRAEKQKVVTKLDVPVDPIMLTADAGQLQQVLVNLSLNALDAMPTGGTLTITIRPTAGRVEIIVADTGPGIAKEMLPRIFQPFASSKETGVGLGLVISRRIIQDHGGSLQAANRLGGGASFFIDLPLRATTAKGT